MVKFGTDGWRAVIGEDYTFDNLKAVTQAVSEYLKKENKKKRLKVVVGYDTRFLSREFAETTVRVLSGNGIPAALSDKPIPTPVVSFHCRYSGYDLGVMITASHNPYSFNGFKIKTPQGGAADESITNKVETFIFKNKSKSDDSDKLIARAVKDLSPTYESFLKSFFDTKKIKKLKIKVLFDLMHGSGGDFARRVIGKGNIKINYLRAEVNPSFGGINPEPVEKNVARLIKRVRSEGYDLGVALDGDGDRIAAVTSKGRYVNAQVLLPMLAIHMVKNRKVRNGIGKTVVGSNLIDEAALSLGVNCYETPVGFKYISSLFKQGLIGIGGEEAGGIGFSGYIPERDGNAAFLMILEMIAREKKGFAGLIDDIDGKYGRWYYARNAIPAGKIGGSLDKIKLPADILGKKVERVNNMDGVKLITKNSWLMFRKSGTEPIVRVYAEARTRREAEAMIKLGERMVYGL